MTSLNEAVLSWIATTLPAVTPPQPRTLDLLTEAPAAVDMFHFLITRVYASQQADSIRAQLTLDENYSSTTTHSSDENSTDVELGYDDASIAQLLTQIREEEHRLSSFHAQFDVNPPSSTHSATWCPAPLNDGYDSIFSSPTVNSTATRKAAKNALADILTDTTDAAGDALSLLYTFQTARDTASPHPRTSSPSSLLHSAHIHATSAELQAAISNAAHMAIDEPPDPIQLDASLATLQLGDASLLSTRLLPCVRNAARRRVAESVTNALLEHKQKTQLDPDESPHIRKPECADGIGGEDDIDADVNSSNGCSGSVVGDELGIMTARDAQLRAGAEWRTRTGTASEARTHSDAVTHEIRCVDGGGSGDAAIAYAALQGERAVLAFCTNGEAAGRFACMDGGIFGVGEEELAAVRVGREGNAIQCAERVAELEESVRRLSSGSLRSLSQLGMSARQETVENGRLRERVEDAVGVGLESADAVDLAVRGTDVWVGDGGGDSEQKESGDDDGVKGEDTVARSRVDMCLGWAKKCEGLRRKVRMRADVAAENRERTMQRVDETTVEVMKEAMQGARRCRERDAVMVQHEMRNWATQPAREAAEWMVGVERIGV